MPEAIEIQLKKGALELCVLALLSQHDSYAYEIASRSPTRSAWAKARSIR